MKILLHSFTFWPNAGGVESVSHILAKGFAEAGHTVVIVTETVSLNEQEQPYKIIRKPNIQEQLRQVKYCDLVVSNGASLKYLPLACLARKPFVWIHATYRLTCLDGLGWAAGKIAPLTPLASIVHHLRLFGLKSALIGALKLACLKIASHLVTAHVAVSQHVAYRQPLPRQLVIYNPFDLNLFATANKQEAEDNLAQADSTFTYLGRLVAEKGVSHLLMAFAKLCSQQENRRLTLKIIGDGPERPALQSLAFQLGIRQQVRWLGSKSGLALREEVQKAGICVIPSVWEEPLGIVALELMAAGKPLIVSQIGGLRECTQDACLSFPNGNYQALAQCMQKLLNNPALTQDLVRQGLQQVEKFKPASQITAYLELFAQLVHS